MKKIFFIIAILHLVCYANENTKYPNLAEQTPIDVSYLDNSLNFSYLQDQYNKIKADIKIQKQTTIKDETKESKEIINIAKIGFTTDNLDFNIGRQPIKNNYYDGIVGVLSLDKIKFTGIYTTTEESSEQIDSKSVVNKYATYYLKASYNALDSIKANVFYLNHGLFDNADQNMTHLQNNTTSIGTKIEATANNMLFAIKYINSSASDSEIKHGQILETSLKYKFQNHLITTGYMTADEYVNFDNLSFVKDDFEILHPGNMAYLMANTKINNFDLETYYKITKLNIADSQKISIDIPYKKEKAISLSINKKLAKNLKAGISYKNTSSEAGKYEDLVASVKYFF